jgi:cell division septation protein DedD
MPKNEEGEFELILGNKQLLSVFFLVVILLGVFFTMGYVVGRNSAPIEASNRATEGAVPGTSASKGSPMVVDPPAKSTDTPTTSTPPPGIASPQDPNSTAQATTTTTAPAQTAAPTPTAPAPGEVITPQPGDLYVQVLALAKPEAEVLVDVLSKKGFRAVVAPGPNDRLFRVLVGPAKDAEELTKLRNDVEAAGFKGAFPKKY